MLRYAPEADFNTHVVELTFNREGMFACIYVGVLSDATGIDVIHECTYVRDEPYEEDEEEEEDSDLYDFLAASAEDPRNARSLSVLLDPEATPGSEADVIGIAIHLRAPGSARDSAPLTITSDLEMWLVGARIISVEAATEEEIRMLIESGVIDDGEGE